MTSEPKLSAAALRRLVEERLQGRSQGANVPLTAEEAARLLHELQIHQIELEMQNEELRAARTESEASRQRFEELYDFAPVGYLTVGEAGGIEEANLTAATLLGEARAKLIGQCFALFILPDDRGLYSRHGQTLAATTVPQTCEVRLTPKDRPPFWARLEAVPAVSSGDGAPECRLTLSDISRSKEAMEEHKDLQAQLHQAQKMEAIGRLAGGVAHDFNNMLGVILGHVDLALDTVAPDQPLFKDLQSIQNAAERSADLTRQLLAFARKQLIAPKVLDLNESVTGMLKIVRRLIGEDVELTWQPGTGLWPHLLDPGQVDQLLANLCVNARDAIGGVGKVGKVGIKTERAVFDEAYCAGHQGFMVGEFVALAVSDNGCGMDKETLANIFEPFFTTKEVGKGTGLGLATVYGVVKQNKGFISVDSEPGQGTTFTIYLPRHHGKIEEGQEKGVRQAKARGHETILLVEDEPVVLEMGQTMLERLGYTVLAAAMPGKAVQLAKEEASAIDLLPTDVIMPTMNGCDLARQLLALRPSLKVLFMSGYTADVIAQHAVLDEGVHFIQKPFSQHDLAAKVREVLDGGLGGGVKR